MTWPFASSAAAVKLNCPPVVTVTLLGLMCTLVAFAPTPVYLSGICTARATVAEVVATTGMGLPLNTVSPCASMQ